MTIAVACFNAQRHLAVALGSLLAQTRSDFEVIVVDDCSTDASAALAAQIGARDPRVRVDRLAANGGPAAARNRALQLARGTWFAVLDADDFFAPDRLERMLALASDHDADLVADNLLVFDESGAAPAQLFLAPANSGLLVDLERYLSETVMFRPGANYGYLKPMFRTALLRSLPYAYDERLRIGEDDDLVLRLLMGGARYWIDREPRYAYRRHAGSISHRLDASRAGALERAARDFEAIAAPARIGALLRDRRRAFARARAFAELVAAIKARAWGAALTVAGSNPAAALLLAEPIKVRLQRFWPFAPKARTGQHGEELGDLLEQWQRHAGGHSRPD